MKKRLISVALVLVMVLSLLPVAAMAASYDDFTDLKDDVWYTPYINFVLEKGYFIGMSETEFAPSGTMTRAMFVTVIARMEGVEVDNTVEPTFPDVKANVWYTGSVEWAAANGIVEGYEDGTFRPGNDVTRREMAAIMDRYIDWRAETTGDVHVVDGVEKDFTDADQFGWAKEYIDTCVAYGLLEGYPDGSFGPARNSTRAEVSAVIYRLDFIIHDDQPVDYIYNGVSGVMNTVKDVIKKSVVKAEDLSAEYKDYIATLDENVADIVVADYVDASAVIGEDVNGTRTVSLTGSAPLNQSTVFNVVKTAVGLAVTLVDDQDDYSWAEVKDIVDAVKADIEGLNIGFLTEMEAAEIAELVYNTVYGKAANLWTSNFKGENGYYTGDIAVKVGDYTATIVVDDEAGVSVPNWKQDALGLAVETAKEVAKSFLAQAKDYTSSLTNIGPVIDITFSAGAYAEDTDNFAYNYPVDISLSFVNEFDFFQYRINNGVSLKAYISEFSQQGFHAAANKALDAIIESDAFQSEFNPAVSEVKESAEFSAIFDVIAEAQGEEAAEKVVDSAIVEWAKTNAESKITGNGEWNNTSIYGLAYVIGGEIYSYVDAELKAGGLLISEDITPEQLEESMAKANVEIAGVDEALKDYVIAVICDKASGEEKYASESGEAYAAMKQYVDTTVPETLEKNEKFNLALEVAERARVALSSVENLCSVEFGVLADALRFAPIQNYIAEKGADSVVARFAKYIELVPAKANVVFAGCTLNEAAVIAIKDATTTAELCNAVADILEETGLAALTLGDFAPEAGQNLTVSYGSKSATVNFVVEFEA